MKEIKPKKKVETVSMYDFGCSDFFLSRSIGRELFFLKQDGKLIQNPKCSVRGEEFFKYIKDYQESLKKQKKK